MPSPALALPHLYAWCCQATQTLSTPLRLAAPLLGALHAASICLQQVPWPCADVRESAKSHSNKRQPPPFPPPTPCKLSESSARLNSHIRRDRPRIQTERRAAWGAGTHPRYAQVVSMLKYGLLRILFFLGSLVRLNTRHVLSVVGRAPAAGFRVCKVNESEAMRANDAVVE